MEGTGVRDLALFGPFPVNNRIMITGTNLCSCGMEKNNAYND